MSGHALMNPQAEASLVGAALMSPVAAAGIVDRGVLPAHFTSGRHRVVFAAIHALVQANHEVSLVTVCDRLARDGTLDPLGGSVAVDAMSADAAAVGALPAHCDIVIDLAEWRRRQTAAHALLAATDAVDADAFQQAERLLFTEEHERVRGGDWAPDRAAEDFMSALEGSSTDVFPWPFARLNHKSDGGVARGEITILAGPITHGKSALLDMCLESMHRPGLKVWLYLNEMKRHQRLARVCARRSGVELSRIQQAMRGQQRLAGADRDLVRQSWKHYPVHIRECSGWQVERICRHARRVGADIVALDIVNRLPHDASRSRTQQLDDAANQLDQLAKEMDLHVIVAAHLNRLRSAQTGRPPMPSLTDIKECAALAEIADNVLFVWRDTDEAGDPQEAGTVRFAKNRTGELGGLEVRFDGPRQRFLPVDRHLEAAA